jgi:hypothetical protein
LESSGLPLNLEALTGQREVDFAAEFLNVRRDLRPYWAGPKPRPRLTIVTLFMLHLVLAGGILPGTSVRQRAGKIVCSVYHRAPRGLGRSIRLHIPREALPGLE